MYPSPGDSVDENAVWDVEVENAIQLLFILLQQFIKLQTPPREEKAPDARSLC